MLKSYCHYAIGLRGQYCLQVISSIQSCSSLMSSIGGTNLIWREVGQLLAAPCSRRVLWQSFPTQPREKRKGRHPFYDRASTPLSYLPLPSVITGIRRSINKSPILPRINHQRSCRFSKAQQRNPMDLVFRQSYPVPTWVSKDVIFSSQSIQPQRAAFSRCLGDYILRLSSMFRRWGKASSPLSNTPLLMMCILSRWSSFGSMHHTPVRYSSANASPQSEQNKPGWPACTSSFGTSLSEFECGYPLPPRIFRLRLPSFSIHLFFCSNVFGVLTITPGGCVMWGWWQVTTGQLLWISVEVLLIARGTFWPIHWELIFS